jgi:hypothetical protein
MKRGEFRGIRLAAHMIVKNNTERLKSTVLAGMWGKRSGGNHQTFNNLKHFGKLILIKGSVSRKFKQIIQLCVRQSYLYSNSW